MHTYNILTKGVYKMVLINGVKIDSKDERKEDLQKKPSINEILEKMQSNYNKINSVVVQSNDFTKNYEEDSQKTSTMGLSGGDNNLLLTLLPMLLNKSGDGTAILQKEQNEIFHTLLKNLNNPLLEKLFELLPNFKKPRKKAETSTTKKEDPKIESFVKTEDYNCNNR